MAIRQSLSLTALLLAVSAAMSGSSQAGEGWETYGVPARGVPWAQPGFQGYNETSKPAQPAPSEVSTAPRKYTITVASLPQKVQGENPNIAVLMAHLPEHAAIWFNGSPTQSKGMVRYFESPPLTPGKRYAYTVRIVWHEKGKWVHKVEKVPVRSGEIHCIYLTPADEAATVADNLSKLAPEDRKLAEAQKRCPIQTDNPLGSMGVPVKLTLKGQTVFVCCKECADKAKADPDKTLATVGKWKEKAIEKKGK